MAQRFQFSLSSLLILTAMCAVVFGIGRLIPLVMAILICIVPFCLIAERVLGGLSIADTQTSGGSRWKRVLVFALCAVSVSIVAWISIVEGSPELVSPLPFMVVLPLLFENALWDMYGQMPWLSCVAVPVATFVIFYWPVTRARSGALPFRVPILLFIATLLSAVWFAQFLGYSIEHNSADFTIGVTLANFIFIIGLWAGWYRLKQDASFKARLALCTFLHSWLFWCAFPWLGELI